MRKGRCSEGSRFVPQDSCPARINRFTRRFSIPAIMSLLSMPRRSSLRETNCRTRNIGTIQDIKGIAEIVHERGAVFHTDAVQAVGKIPVNVRELDVDFLTLSGHKMYGPKGIGALYVKKGAPFCPLIRGGHQERGRRAGTENTLGIIGLGKAVEMRAQEMKSDEKHLLEMKAALKKGIEENIPDVRFVGHPTDCIPNTLNVSFEGAEGEAIILYLALEGIAVSTGSACTSGALEPSHVLLAMGLPQRLAQGAVRFSLGRETGQEELDYTVAVLVETIHRLRSMSPAYADYRKRKKTEPSPFP